MATTSIGNGASGFVAAELVQSITQDIVKELSASAIAMGKVAQGPPTPAISPTATSPAAAPAVPASDLSFILMSEVATADLTKLTRILEPASNPDESVILDSLLRSAVLEVNRGNAERAIGYLADYATRDPGKAEDLPQIPAFEIVRDKIETMVNRMTVVAKISAEDGLMRAEQATSRESGKVSDWETHSGVLLQLAQRFYESGGYANYSRTTQLAKLVSEAAEAKPTVQALAASASGTGASISAPANELVQGLNVPYWVPPEMPAKPRDPMLAKLQKAESNPWSQARRNWKDIIDILGFAGRQLWHRAPLLVMLLVWFTLGVSGGLVFALMGHFNPDSVFLAAGNLAFDLWGIGFLVLVGFGFYARIRYRPLR